jgi:hypothetical protein
MPFLRAFRETIPSLKLLYQNLPHTIKGKLSLIEDIHDRVWVHHLAKRQGPAPDFDTHLENIKLLWEETSHKIASEEGQGTCPSITHKLEKELKEYIRLMANPALEPPQIFSHLFGMLTGLWRFWVYWPYSREWVGIDHAPGRLSEAMGLTPPSFWEVEVALDLSLAKLALLVGIETADIRHWGKKKEAVARLNMEKRAKAIEREVAILSAFARAKKEPEDTLNRIVGRICNLLDKDEQMETPSKKNIERTLKANSNLMEKCFREELRGNKKRFVFIRHTGV